MDVEYKISRGKRLRNTLAINRGIEFLRDFRPKSNVTQTQWGSYLNGLFRQVYLQLFTDTTPVSPQQRLAGIIDSSQRAFELSTLFHDFARKFYDANGFFATTHKERNAEKMAELYIKLEEFSAFGEDTSLVLRVFFAALGRMRGFQEKLGGIDFRRLSAQHEKVLLHTPKSLDEMRDIFLCAMDPARTQAYRENTPPHFYWEDRSITLYGQRLIRVQREEIDITLFDEVEAKEELIVLINGALVTASHLETAIRKHMESGKLLGELRIAREFWVGRLAALDCDLFGSPIYEKTEIDSIDISQGALPICMNLHPLTLLTHAQHERLEHYLNSEFNASIEKLCNAAFAEEVLQSLRDYERGQRIVSLATAQMTKVKCQIDESITFELSQHPEAQQKHMPHMVMTMGGSGSGKSSNHYFNSHYMDAEGYIRSDYIYASLDEGRPYSDIYHVLIAAGHHADDYEAVHLWADTRRNWLCEKARQQHYNVIFDGSGVEYKNRYDKVVKAFSEAGYQTELIAADCPLIATQAQREYYPVPALERIMYRAGYRPDGSSLPPKKSGHYRTLPWRIAINKHIGFPRSFLAALGDKNLGKIILVDNAGEEGQDHVIAESFILDDDDLNALENAQRYNALLRELESSDLLPYENQIETLDESNCGFLAARVEGINHVLIMTNVERMIDLFEKAQLNPNAHGPSNLTLVKFLASFIINSIDKPEGEDTTPSQVRQAYEEVLANEANTPRPNYLHLNIRQ